MEWKELHNIENLDTVELTDDQDFYLSVVAALDHEDLIIAINIPRNANSAEEVDEEVLEAKCDVMTEKLDRPTKLAEYIQERLAAPETQLVEVTFESLKHDLSFSKFTSKQRFCLDLVNTIDFKNLCYLLDESNSKHLTAVSNCDNSLELANYFYNKQKDI